MEGTQEKGEGMTDATMRLAKAYAAGPDDTYLIRRSIIAELVAENERLRQMNERAISRLAAACEVLCAVARREGVTACPRCLEAFDAVGS